MIDRGQLELAQMTDRLLKSRDRPKRQWFIERIRRIWSHPQRRRCCLVGHGKSHQVHAKPTPESVDAVASFANDSNLNVRVAVAAAMGTPTVPLDDSLRVLSKMLSDDHPVVRANAARWLSYDSRTASLDDDTLNLALADDTYSVRWAIASSLHDTEHANRAWSVLRDSLPRTDVPLFDWLQCCLPYQDRFVVDSGLQSTVSRRLATMDSEHYLREQYHNMFGRLLIPRKMAEQTDEREPE